MAGVGDLGLALLLSQLDDSEQEALLRSMADVADAKKQEVLQEAHLPETLTQTDAEAREQEALEEAHFQQAMALSMADAAEAQKQDELEESHLQEAVTQSDAAESGKRKQEALEEARLARSMAAESWRRRSTEVGSVPSITESAFEKSLKRITWTKDNLALLESLRDNRSVIEKAIADDKSLATAVDSPQLPRGAVLGKVWTIGDIPRLGLMRHNMCLERPRVAPANADDWDGIQGLPWLEARAREFSPESGCKWRTAIDQLMDYCGCSNDRERAKAIFVWEACHLTWTKKCMERDNEPNDPTSCETLLDAIVETRLCVCVGYAALFAAACRHVGLQAEYISGWTKLTKRAMDQDGEGLSGHVWNAVQLPQSGDHEKRWFMVDCGWSKRDDDNFNETFWAVPPEWLIPLFFPRSQAHQHMEGVEGGPWSRQKFLDMPAFFPAYHMMQKSQDVNLQLDDVTTYWHHFLVGLDRHKIKHMTFRARSADIVSVQVDMACASTFTKLVDDEDTQHLPTAYAQVAVFPRTPEIELERDIHQFRATILLSHAPVEKSCVRLIVWARRQRKVDGIQSMQFETVQLMQVIAELRK